jgi:hypothetical protein
VTSAPNLELFAVRKRTSIKLELQKAGHVKNQRLMDDFINEADVLHQMTTSAKFLDQKMLLFVAMH